MRQLLEQRLRLPGLRDRRHQVISLRRGPPVPLRGRRVGTPSPTRCSSCKRRLRRLGFASEIFAEHIDAGPRGPHPARSTGTPDPSRTSCSSTTRSATTPSTPSSACPNDIVAIYHNVTPERVLHHQRGRCGATSGWAGSSWPPWPVGRCSAWPTRTSTAARCWRPASGGSTYSRCKVDFSEFAPTTDGDGSRVQATGSTSAGWWETSASTSWSAAFALYHRDFEPDARLILIGDTSVADYVDRVRHEADRAQVADRVVILGKVSDDQLRSAFAARGDLRLAE